MRRRRNVTDITNAFFSGRGVGALGQLDLGRQKASDGVNGLCVAYPHRGGRKYSLTRVIHSPFSALKSLGRVLMN
jgi:hypothetical protein